MPVNSFAWKKFIIWVNSTSTLMNNGYFATAANFLYNNF